MYSYNAYLLEQMMEIPASDPPDAGIEHLPAEESPSRPIRLGKQLRRLCEYLGHALVTWGGGFGTRSARLHPEP